MISLQTFETVRKKFGNVASWAVWADEALKPKSNMGDLSVFDLQRNPSLLDVLQSNIVMVGLNFSRPVIQTNPFKNFHDTNPRANDFKIRFAFRGTDFYGAYMTDVIKNLEMKNSRDVINYLKINSSLVQKNISEFREELETLQGSKPILLVFGNSAFNILSKNLEKGEYSALIKLTHYSYRISKENYKNGVLGQIHADLPENVMEKKEVGANIQIC